jgi:hypothetical protein
MPALLARVPDLVASPFDEPLGMQQAKPLCSEAEEKPAVHGTGKEDGEMIRG